MSAWIVEKAHIDALITAGLADPSEPLMWYVGGDEPYHRLTRDTADQVGQMLWDENHKSVNYRYNEDTTTPEYHFRRMQDMEPSWIVKAINCYEYQTCEHDGWEASEARAFCLALGQDLMRRLPGYDEAPWGISEEHRGNPPVSLFELTR